MRVCVGRKTKKVLLETGNYNKILEEIESVENPDKIEDVLKRYYPQISEKYTIRFKAPRNGKYFDKSLMLKKK
jgi:hypothetical protein